MATGGCGGANDALVKEKYPERFQFSTSENFPVYTNKYRMIIVIYFVLVLHFIKTMKLHPLNGLRVEKIQKMFLFSGRQSLRNIYKEKKQTSAWRV